MNTAPNSIKERRQAPLTTPSDLRSNAVRDIGGALTRDDNLRLVTAMRETHSLCDEHNDVATASLLEVWIDESERRVWFLYEAGRRDSV